MKYATRSSTKRMREVRAESKELFESGEEADEPAEEEESMDYYREVLMTSGATTPKSPRLGEEFSLDANDKQSRADMTDLMASLSVYFARLLRVHNARMSALAIKGGGRPSTKR